MFKFEVRKIPTVFVTQFLIIHSKKISRFTEKAKRLRCFQNTLELWTNVTGIKFKWVKIACYHVYLFLSDTVSLHIMNTNVKLKGINCSTSENFYFERHQHELSDVMKMWFVKPSRSWWNFFRATIFLQDEPMQFEACSDEIGYAFTQVLPQTITVNNSPVIFQLFVTRAVFE